MHRAFQQLLPEEARQLERAKPTFRSRTNILKMVLRMVGTARKRRMVAWERVPSRSCRAKQECPRLLLEGRHLLPCLLQMLWPRRRCLPCKRLAGNPAARACRNPSLSSRRRSRRNGLTNDGIHKRTGMIGRIGSKATTRRLNGNGRNGGMMNGRRGKRRRTGRRRILPRRCRASPRLFRSQALRLRSPDHPVSRHLQICWARSRGDSWHRSRRPRNRHHVGWRFRSTRKKRNGTRRLIPGMETDPEDNGRPIATKMTMMAGGNLGMIGRTGREAGRRRYGKGRTTTGASGKGSRTRTGRTGKAKASGVTRRKRKK
mmetsp:Transcript_102631/g.244639  ORF Transcript_102631/g.244639 Transcript_102631/m.244639 type:complete len:316 (+) Transcript_102631:130-1077(+)